MDVETTASESQAVVLLGKKYPVILCSGSSISPQNVVHSNFMEDSSSNNVDNDTMTTVAEQNLPPDTVENASIIDSSNGVSSDVQSTAHEEIQILLESGSTVSAGNISTDIQSNSHQEIQYSSDNISNVIENLNRESADSTETAQGVNLSEISAEVRNGEDESVSTDDAVALALSINDNDTEPAFQYEINETDIDCGAASENRPDPMPAHNEPSANDALAENGSLLSSATQQVSQISRTVVDVADSTVNANVMQSSESAPQNQNEALSDTGPVFSVSNKLNISEYAQSEWKGTTYRAECLRNGYQMLIASTDCNFMRQIRGDNYCALRATAFQILSQNSNILTSYSDWKLHLSTLPKRLLNDYNCTWLCNWTFADRLSSSLDNRLSVMQDCINYFIEAKELSNAMPNNDDRIAHFTALFNSGSAAEIKLFEAIKLMMLETAVSLHHLQKSDKEVPIFAWLLFARDTSIDPESLMMNHLNLAGKSGGLEQVEMCLLGQALEITLRVFRPSQVEQEDFVSHYPDHMLEVWDQIDLIAEDDRHYNIVVT